MFNVGDIVYISKYANSIQLDNSSALKPGDGPFTILYYNKVVDNSDDVLNVYLKEAGWWVNEGALILEADKKNPKSKLERKIALIYKRYEERNM
jgi:hypothetical protein